MKRGVAGRTGLFLVLALGVIVLTAGCAGIGNDSPIGADEPDRPAIFEETVESLDGENASAFEAAVTDEDGALTDEGERFLTALESDAEIGEPHRTAVARSIAQDGLETESVETLEQLLESTDGSQSTILAHGLRDTSGDGILDGEARLLGVDPATAQPELADAVVSLRASGYESGDVEYLKRVETLRNDDSLYQQARSLALIEDGTANGTATEADRWALQDDSGDGILNGMAASLGIDAAETHVQLGSYVTRLAPGGYHETELDYLRAVAAIDGSSPEWRQAEALGLLNETVDSGTVSGETVAALAQREDGLLHGFADRLALGQDTDNETVAELATALTVDGYTDEDVQFLQQVAVVTGDAVLYEQARSLDLLDEPVTNGSVGPSATAAIVDGSGDGLLHGMAERLGLDPAGSHPTVAEFATPLAEDGYSDTEFAYLSRIDELAETRGNEYELWSQAENLTLLHDAVANGSVTSQQVWGIENDADNQLLNAMEVEFGTDPELADTSGDGYEDHIAWGPMRDLGLAVTPGEVDLHVEIDSVEGQEPPTPDQRAEIRSTFREEPGPEVGPIHVHFHDCEHDRESIESVESMQDVAEDYRSIRGLGIHYLLVNDGTVATEDNDVPGVAYLSETEPSWMIVDGTLSERARTDIETSVIAHELGHSFGVLDSDFDGVDSEEYTATEYESVMNYNHWTPVTFSAGEPFDDYAQMASQSFGAYHQNVSALERMWEAGAVDHDVLC